MVDLPISWLTHSQPASLGSQLLQVVRVFQATGCICYVQ